jgi:membrane-associated phospholipid phosphatase
MHKWTRGLLISLLGAPALGAQQDSSAGPARATPPLVTRGEVTWAVAGTAAGIALMQYDSRIARWFMAPERQTRAARQRADRVALVNEKPLFAAGLLLWGIGRATGRETLADVSWHTAEALLITTLGTSAVRVATGRSRPFKSGGRDPFDYHPFDGWNDQAYRSIPSLHAAAAFTTAAVVTSEVRRRRPGLTKIVAPVSFALATLPGLARLQQDKHWASDVALGTVVGTTIGIATVRWHHTRDDRLDRWMLGAARAPNGDAMLVLGRPSAPR